MNTLAVKIPDNLASEIAAAAAREHVSKSELVRRALEAYLVQKKTDAPFVSALDLAGDLVGCFHGGPDDLAVAPVRALFQRYENVPASLADACLILKTAFDLVAGVSKPRQRWCLVWIKA